MMEEGGRSATLRRRPANHCVASGTVKLMPTSWPEAVRSRMVVTSPSTSALPPLLYSNRWSAVSWAWSASNSLAECRTV